MKKQIIECVPNFSNGRDKSVIDNITNQIKLVQGVKLLSVERGEATNRTVVTFVGEPEKVIKAAFLAIKKASELIDMSKQTGEHPRMGATDVCPLIPISGISMEETVNYAKKLGKRVGEELKIPIYLYEDAATKHDRKNLANIRSGEYEALEEKLKQKEWKPDFGSTSFDIVQKTGATAIGARDFLIAYNINLNTTSTRRANAVAFDIREKGRISREGGTLNGKILKDKKGNTIWKPGSLKHVKAIGWFIQEYGAAQISMNLTNIKETPIHIVFDEVCKKAQERGLRVTGSELVGLIPLKSMLDAGKYFLKKQNRSLGIEDSEIIKIAIKTMGLDELEDFNPNEKIIEYNINDDNGDLCKLSLVDFAQKTASEAPAPGGGSVSAYLGSLGISLGTMVANLSSHKRGWDDRWEEFSNIAEKGQKLIKKLLDLVDKDTESFNQIMQAFRLPDNDPKEKKIKEKAILKATVHAIEVPLEIMRTSLESMDIIMEMVKNGNPNSVSDAGVGALCARSAVIGGYLNVKINCKDLTEKKLVNEFLNKAEKIKESAIKLEEDILKITLEKI
ncbi:MAG: glutamate formimidoyltransferase [Flavobacteriales bacterium]|nr:glutamate formimidoyltransferase [Flavobacteriales bacterium]